MNAVVDQKFGNDLQTGSAVKKLLPEHAVIGLPHRVLGEEVGAVVQVAPGAAVTGDQLAAHVAERLAAFKVPVRFEMRDAPLPRNANGKILKQQLKDELGV